MNEEMSRNLLAYAESVANSRSSNLHGFHSSIVEEARRVVKAAGGRLDKVGRYEEGSAAWRPYGKYQDGQWIHPTLNRETDKYEYQTDVTGKFIGRSTASFHG